MKPTFIIEPEIKPQPSYPFLVASLKVVHVWLIRSPHCWHPLGEVRIDLRLTRPLPPCTSLYTNTAFILNNTTVITDTNSIYLVNLSNYWEKFKNYKCIHRKWICMAGHRIDLWLYSATLTLNLGASKYPSLQVHMLTSTQLFIYSTFTNYKNLGETDGKGQIYKPPPPLWRTGA